MKKYLLLGIGILFFFGILFPQNSSAQNHPVTFQISKGFGKVNGYFKEVDYSIQLHTANPKLSGTAKVSSIETNNDKRDRDLQKKEWFDATNHPKIVVESTSVEKTSENHYTGTFNITIKGITQIKKISFQTNNDYFKANFQLNINDFDLGGGVMKMLIGKEVSVTLHIPMAGK